MMDYLPLIKRIAAFLVGALMLVAVGVYAGVSMRSDYVPQEHVDTMVGQHTRAMSALRTSFEAVEDSLRAKNEVLYQHIKDQQETVQLYADLSAELRIERDSLQEQISYAIPSEWLQAETLPERASEPTRMTFTQTFTDGLFEVRSEVYALEGRLFNDLYLEQLRNIDLRLTVTEREASNTLVLYAMAPELNIEEMMVYRPEAQQTPRIDTQNWFKRNLFSRRMVFVSGALVGVLITSQL